MPGTIKIGILTPYSGVYPYYGHHLTAGMLLGLYSAAPKRNEVQFVPAYTNMGDPKSALDAVNKLLFFEQVDIVSGLINYKSAPDVLPVIEKHNKLGFFFDMGEYIPWFDYLSPRMFYNSQQIWQTQYALGYWATREFGSGGMCVMTVYEAGYHISSCFHQGTVDAGSSALRLHVIPHEKSAPKDIDFTDFFDKIRKEPPPYVHAIFAGSIGNEFLAAWKNSGFHKTIPLIVAENMAYEDMLMDVGAHDLEFYSAGTWSRSGEDIRNIEFVKRFEALGGQTANVFGLLGYESGLALREVKSLILKRDIPRVAELLQKESIVGPRGERNFFPASGFALPTIDIVKVKTSALNIHKTIVSQGKGLKFDAQQFRQIHQESVSGWLNPYLCM